MARSRGDGSEPSAKASVVVVFVLVGLFLGFCVWADNQTRVVRTPRPASVTVNIPEAPQIAALDPSEVPDEVRYGLPYVGMPSRYLSSTWLGRYDHATVIGDHYDYVWYGSHGDSDIAFVAMVKNGLVDQVVNFAGLEAPGVPEQDARESQPEDEGAVADLVAEGPADGREDATGTQEDTAGRREDEPAGTGGMPSWSFDPSVYDGAPDPYDYDDPDDYARDYEDWASSNGRDGGSYDDAYDEWVFEVADGDWDEW